MTDKDTPERTIHKRSRASVPVSQLVEKVAKESFRKHGLAESRLITEWHSITGPLIARYAIPQKLAFQKGKRDGGTLHLLVESAWALEVQHLEPQILEKIATYFGYRAVATIRIKQGQLPIRPTAPTKALKPLSPASKAKLSKATAAVGDPELKEALEKLGEAVLRKNTRVDS